MSGIYWFLNLVESLHPKINTGTIQYFNYDLYNIFTVHVHNLVTDEFLLFIACTLYNKCSKYHPPESVHFGHDLSWSVSRSLRSPGVANGLKGVKKCVGLVSVHFQLELNTLGPLGTPAPKKN